MEAFFAIINRNCEEALDLMTINYGPQLSSQEWALKNIVELVDKLYANKMLPAIVFLKTNELCDQLAMRLVETLKAREKSSKDASAKHIKQLTKAQKVKQQQLKKTKFAGKDSWKDESAEHEELASGMIDVDEIDDKYTYLDPSYKIDRKELDEEIDQNRFRSNIPKVLYEGSYNNFYKYRILEK